MAEHPTERQCKSGPCCTHQALCGTPRVHRSSKFVPRVLFSSLSISFTSFCIFSPDVTDAVGSEEDTYGAEMRLYLKQEDVLPRGQTNESGIRRFLAASKDRESTNEETSGTRYLDISVNSLIMHWFYPAVWSFFMCTSSVAPPKRTKRKTRVLPVIESMPVEVASDDDLPDFGKKRTVQKCVLSLSY